MNTRDPNSATLLPNGLLDLLPPQAELEAATIESFFKNFAAFGYARVKPPLVEFEESLLGEGPGQKLARKTFRLMDPVSQRMMGVRADMTSQIARIAHSRLGGEPRPLRLSYAGDVLRVNGTQLRPERQFCQVGCELIGEDSVQADVEAILIALKALSDAGIKDLSVDLTVPMLVNHIYDGTNAGAEERVALDGLIEKRDGDALRAEKSAAAGYIAQLTGVEGTAERAMEALSKITLPKGAAANIEKLLGVAKDLRGALDIYGLNKIQITIDPLERRGFEYQTGVSFTLFARGASGELGRGGRYNVSLSGETATGFTLYMDSILRVVPALPATSQKEETASGGWASIKSLQDQGFPVVRKA